MRCYRRAILGGPLYFVVLSSAVFTAAFSVAGSARAAGPCATGTRCLAVDKTGAPTAKGTYTAQCSGRFPDFVTQTTIIPAGGPWFKLAQNYPSTLPPTDEPWLKIDFKNGVQGANDYIYALRDYAFDGMIAADFQPENNKVRPWFHMPLMNFGNGAREPTHGLTEERPVAGPELGLKPGVTIHNFAVGFYNAAGGYAIGQVWHTDNPDLSKSRFAEGAMSFKILFSDVTGNDFQNGVDLLAGAPEWTIATTSGLKKVRLMQMDVATVDGRSPTGWVFGTFAFDSSATDPVSWNRLRPVGISWGNDFGYTPADQKAGKKLTESTISDQIPAYAAAHLGWAGRTNGPVDNPISGCLSCHGTAQYPVNAALAPFDKTCATDDQKMQWFRNLKPGEAFGSIDAKTCKLVSLTPPPVTLDFSLQIGVSVQSVLQFHDVNSCAPPSAALKAAIRKVRSNATAARIHR
jgi:hypothetical protein